MGDPGKRDNFVPLLHMSECMEKSFGTIKKDIEIHQIYKKVNNCVV